MRARGATYCIVKSAWLFFSTDPIGALFDCLLDQHPPLHPVNRWKIRFHPFTLWALIGNATEYGIMRWMWRHFTCAFLRPVWLPPGFLYSCPSCKKARFHPLSIYTSFENSNELGNIWWINIHYTCSFVQFFGLPLASVSSSTPCKRTCSTHLEYLQKFELLLNIELPSSCSEIWPVHSWELYVFLSVQHPPLHPVKQ